MNHDIDTIYDTSELHLKWSRAHFRGGRLPQAIDQLSSYETHLSGLISMMTRAVDRDPAVTLAKTQREDDGHIHLYVRVDAAWEDIGYARDKDSLARLIAARGYRGRAVPEQPGAQVMRYFPLVKEEVAHV